MAMMSLRIPDQLAERVRIVAERDKRSVNAELLYLVEFGLEADDALQNMKCGVVVGKAAAR